MEMGNEGAPHAYVRQKAAKYKNEMHLRSICNDDWSKVKKAPTISVVLAVRHQLLLCFSFGANAAAQLNSAVCAALARIAHTRTTYMLLGDSRSTLDEQKRIRVNHS